MTKTIVNIIYTVVNTAFILLISFVVGVVLFARAGLSIDSTISFGDFKLSGLYLKFDKKLVLNVDSLQLGLKGSTNQRLQVNKYFKYIRKYHDYIDYIEINDLEINNNLSTKFQIYNKKDSLFLYINHLNMKDPKLNIRGALQYNTKANKFEFNGLYDVYGINGKVSFESKKDKLIFDVSSNETNSIDPLIEYFQRSGLSKNTAKWMYKNIISKKYKLDNFTGQYDLNSDELLLDTFKAYVKVEDTDIFLADGMPKIGIQDINITLIDETLVFDFDEAIYENQRLFNTKVNIYDLFDSSAGIIIEFDTKSYLNSDVKKILDLYDLDIFVANSTQKLAISLYLKIPFKGTKNSTHKGSVFAKDIGFDFLGVPVKSENLDVSFENGLITFKNTNLKLKDIMDLTSDGTLDTKALTCQLDTTIEHLNINVGTHNIFELHKFKTPIVLDFSKGNQITLEHLNVDLNLSEELSIITLNDVSLVNPYSKFLQNLSFDQGSVVIKSKDFEDFNITAKTLGNAFISNKTDEELQVDIFLEDNSTTIYSKDKVDISIKNGKKVVKANDVNLNLTGIFEEFNNTNEELDMDIHLKNTGITYKKAYLLSTELNASKIGKTFTLRSNYENQNIVKVDNNVSHFSITADTLLASYVNHLAGKDIVKDGIFNLKGKGTSDDIDIAIDFSKTTIKNLTLLNNLVAFFDTVPSLVTFSNPQFSATGYKTKQGKLLLNLKDNNFVTFNDINIEGSNMDIKGNGVIELNSEKVNLNLDVSFLNSLGGIVSKIPIVGHIVLGDEEKFSVDVKVRGDLNDPDISTEFLKDSIKAPLNIIKRTILTPVRLLEKIF